MPSILTVTTPAASFALTTLAAVRGDLGSAAGDVSDGDLQKLIDEASSRIADFCNRVLVRETVLETFRRTSRRAPEVLALTRRPVAAIASVTEDGTVLASEEYEVHPATGGLYRLVNGQMARWTGITVAVAYSGGWISPAIGGSNMPASLEGCCRQLVAALVHGRGADATVRSESSAETGSTSFRDADPADAGLPGPVAAALRGTYVLGGL